MLFIKANEEKQLTFEANIQGVDSKNLRGFVRFMIEDKEYGFPVKIHNNKIYANIPPLQEVVKQDIVDGTEIEAKLEIFIDKYYFTPWNGKVRIESPVEIKATLEEEKVDFDISVQMISETTKKKEQIIETEKIKPKKVPSKKELIKEQLKNITEDDIKKYMERAGSKNPIIQDLILEQVRASTGSTDNFIILKEVIKLLKKETPKD